MFGDQQLSSRAGVSNKSLSAPVGLLEAVFGLPSLLSKVLLLLLAGVLTLALGGLFRGLSYETEEKFGALAWRLFPADRLEERLTIVAIDEHSLNKVGAWPWPREVMADLSEKLAGAGVSIQLFDIVFPEAGKNDREFVAALKKNSAIIAQIPIFDSNHVEQGGLLSSAVQGVKCQPPVPMADGYLANHKNFAGVVKGHITPLVDGDGLIRKQPPLICVNNRVYPSLTLQALLQGFFGGNIAGGSQEVLVTEGRGMLGPDWQLQSAGYLGYKIPLDRDGNLRISYALSPKSFRVVSAADVLNGDVPAELLAGAWALVGATAFGLGDVVPTPHSGMAPGVELQARLMVSMLDGAIPYEPKSSAWVLLFECVIFSCVLLWLSSLGPMLRSIGLPLCAILLPCAALLIHWQLLLGSQVWLGWLAPAMFGFLAAAGLSLLEHKRVRLERSRIYGNLSSYLPEVAAKEIALNLPSDRIEAQRKELVLLCADLRNYSAYESSHSPEEAVALLHGFFIRAADVIVRHGGAVDEFTGDSVLASWPVLQDRNSSLDALSAAQELQRVMSAFVPSPIALGVSIEKGAVLVGSIGPAYRRTHTLLGDTVTLALRIQEMTEELAQPILLGEYAARSLRGEGLVSQGSFLLHGFKIPHVIFAPASLEPAKMLPLEEQDASRLRVVYGGKE